MIVACPKVDSAWVPRVVLVRVSVKVTVPSGTTVDVTLAARVTTTGLADWLRLEVIVVAVGAGMIVKVPVPIAFV